MFVVINLKKHSVFKVMNWQRKRNPTLFEQSFSQWDTIQLFKAVKWWQYFTVHYILSYNPNSSWFGCNVGYICDNKCWNTLVYLSYLVKGTRSHITNKFSSKFTTKSIRFTAHSTTFDTTINSLYSFIFWFLCLLYLLYPILIIII